MPDGFVGNRLVCCGRRVRDLQWRIFPHATSRCSTPCHQDIAGAGGQEFLGQAAHDRGGKPTARVRAHREQVRTEAADPVPERRIGLIVHDLDEERQSRRDLLDDRFELLLFLLTQLSVGCVDLPSFVRSPFTGGCRRGLAGSRRSALCGKPIQGRA